jgi:hypothetical protein
MKLFQIGLGLLLAATPVLAQDSQPTGARPEKGAPTTTEVDSIPAVVQETPRVGEFRWTTEERIARAEKLINEPLVVNDVEIPSAEIRRALLLKVGRVQLESRKLDLMIDAEVEMRRKLGEEVTDTGLTPEEEQVAFDQAVSQIRTQYPNMSVEDVLASNSLSIESLKRQLTQTKRFDRVFLPEDPDLWPATTVGALEGQMGAEMVTQMKENWKARQANAADNATDPGQMMWNRLMRQMVMQALMQNAEVLSPVDGLPIEVAQRVNGKDTLVADVWPEVKSLVHPEDVRRMRLYLARLTAVQQDLFNKGAWLSDEDFGQIFDAEEKIGEGSPWNLQMIVIVMKRYPNMNVYKEVLRAERSYEKLIADELTEENLQGWLPRASRLLGLGEVTPEIILLSSFDYTRNGWRDNGWEMAEKRANEVVDALVASEGADWDKLLEENSDFYDPPQPQAQQPNQQPPQLKNKGRFGSIHRNRLMQMLGESEFTAFVDGSSIADQVYYDQEAGAIDGPFRGIHGYYITRVNSRTNGQKPILLSDPNMRKMVTEDYVMQHFIGYASRVLDEADVQGLD